MGKTDQKKEEKRRLGIDLPEFDIRDGERAMYTIRGYRALDLDSD